MNTEYILTLSCPDKQGIVAAVSTFLSGRGCNILSSGQYGDPVSNTFFMRVRFADEQNAARTEDAFVADFHSIAVAYSMQWRLHAAARRTRALILVSKFGHCLNDLVYRTQTGALAMDIAGIVSNHKDFEEFARRQNIPYHYLPVTPANKAEQEARLLALAREEQTDLLILARYMQVLSPALCREFYGRCINIHHSFLPSFRGAKPYQQAYDRGVKLIGATAHYVTGDLDEGPIIEQDAERVDHAHSVADLVFVGRDIESVVLARAVKYHLEHRVLLNGSKTVVLK